MMLDIRLYATLRKYGAVKSGAITVDVPESLTVRQLLAKLAIPAAEVKIAMVNGVSAELTQVLAARDRVGLFPPVGGG